MESQHEVRQDHARRRGADSSNDDVVVDSVTAKPQSVRVIRLALIGCGGIAPYHLRALAQASEIRSNDESLPPTSRFRFSVVAAIDVSLETAEKVFLFSCSSISLFFSYYILMRDSGAFMKLVANTRKDPVTENIFDANCRLFRSYDALLEEEKKESRLAK